MLIFHSRMDGVRWIEASREPVRRDHWRCKIDWILLVLGKPIRTISMKHSGHSVPQFHATFALHFPWIARTRGCVEKYSNLFRNLPNKNFHNAPRRHRFRRVIREILRAIFHNLSILRPRSLEEKEQKERREKRKGRKKKEEKKKRTLLLRVPLSARCASVYTCTGASTDVIEPSQACWAREKWLDSPSTLKWSEF